MVTNNTLPEERYPLRKPIKKRPNEPINILKLVRIVEKYSKKIRLYKRKIQKADVLKTHGDNKKIIKYKLIKKFTPIEEGIKNTLEWYKKYNNF